MVDDCDYMEAGGDDESADVMMLAMELFLVQLMVLVMVKLLEVMVLVLKIVKCSTVKRSENLPIITATKENGWYSLNTFFQ